ncbi:MAG: hypothetical protein ACE366_05625 [Bradymonadia bacterium]
MSHPRTPTPLSFAQQLSAATFWATLHLKRQLSHRRFWLWAWGLGALLLTLKGATQIPLPALAALALFLLMPMICLFFGAGVIRADIDDSTLTYPFTRPLGRRWIFGARFAGALILVWLLVVPMGIICALDDPSYMAPFIATTLLGGLAYTSLFALLGVWVKWSTWIGLGWILLWEQGVSLVPGFLGRLALVTHLRAVAHQPVAGNSPLAALWEPPSMTLAWSVLLLVPLVAIWLSTRRVHRKAFVIAR